MIPCPTCTAPAGRIRTVAEDDGWRHYYACLRVGTHRFSTTERIADKPRVDRQQVGRLIRQAETINEELRRVLGVGQ